MKGYRPISQAEYDRLVREGAKALRGSRIEMVGYLRAGEVRLWNATGRGAYVPTAEHPHACGVTRVR